jgi:hypothetical protein
LKALQDYFSIDSLPRISLAKDSSLSSGFSDVSLNISVTRTVPTSEISARSKRRIQQTNQSNSPQNYHSTI